MYGESHDKLKLKTEYAREVDSVKAALRALAELPDVQIVDLLNLMPHQVDDLKDVVRKSNL